jgi:nitrogen fixation/metabolism regulation signal transduction histidine kinase
LVIAIVLSSFVYLNSQNPYAGKTENVSYANFDSEAHALMYIAQDQKFFASNGINLTITNVGAGAAAINAVQAMPDGGKLVVNAYKTENDVTIAVQDTGVGILENVKNKLFTPLFTTKSKGQGFGLAVVKRLVEAQNGSITVESQEGKGKTFTIKFPPPQ